MWSVLLLMSAAQTLPFGRRGPNPGSGQPSEADASTTAWEVTVYSLMLYPVLVSPHGNWISAGPCLEGGEHDSPVHFTGVAKSDGTARKGKPIIPPIHAGVPSAPGPEKSTQ